MWFRLTADGKREYVIHTDQNLVSPTYKGRTRYTGSYKTCNLQITNIRSTDSGLYHFRFVTDHWQGKWTSLDAAILSITDAPRATSVTVSRSGAIMVGNSVTLTCSSSADPPVESYAWFKDQQSVSVPDSFKPQLHLWKTDPSNFGLYHCVARSSLGFERSKPILLNITYAPTGTQVLISPGGDIMEGSSVNLTCHSNANPPVERYAWYQVVGTRSWSKGSMQNISFPSIRAHHGGQYYCTVWNPLGKETSVAVLLPVLYAPKNTSVSARPSGEIDAGTSVTLTCSSVANPAVENYTWFRIDEAEARVTRSGPSYTIAEVSPGEGGRYYCEARNRIGAHSSPILTVRAAQGGVCRCVAGCKTQRTGRLKVIALASAVGVSAGLITLTVMVMISKNMHRVDMESAEEDKEVELIHQRSSSTGDTLFLETLQETFQVMPTKMTDIPEEPEEVYENVHPCIVPMKDMPQKSEEVGPLNYITVHFSQISSQDEIPATTTPPSNDMTRNRHCSLSCLSARMKFLPQLHHQPETQSLKRPLMSSTRLWPGPVTCRECATQWKELESRLESKMAKGAVCLEFDQDNVQMQT
ncbi:hypothetical protein GJAV_G00004890 [Gymnothorax javanicus]|nr:hypothetical protein GJAV_G00004890 [Gymnothorax javanicus]